MKEEGTEGTKKVEPRDPTRPDPTRLDICSLSSACGPKQKHPNKDKFSKIKTETILTVSSPEMKKEITTSASACVWRTFICVALK